MAHGQIWEGDVRWLFQQDIFMFDGYDYYVEITKYKDTIVNDQKAYSFITKGLATYPFQNEVVKSGSDTSLVMSYENGKVKYLDPYTNEFLQLYDFSLQKGDTLYTACDYDPLYSRYLIDSIDREFIAGKHRRIQYIHRIGMESYCFFPEKIIEGIGSMEYFMARYCCVDPQPGGYLLCFEEDGVIYDNTFNSCDYLVSTENLTNSQLKIFPNPTHDLLNITGIEVKSIELFDINGEKVKVSHKNEISLSELKSGIYIIRINTANGMHMSKIVKQ